MTLKALIFDVDGTLAETEELHRESFNAAFAEAGLAWVWDRDDYRRLLAVTGGKERVRAFESERGLNPLGEDALRALHSHKTMFFTEGMATGRVPLRPGVEELMLRGRERGLALAVATTTSRPNVDALCRATWGRKAAEVFDVIAAGDEVAAKKPAPDIYVLALARLGVDAGETLAFEDSEAGVAAAHRAGLSVVAAPSVYTCHQDLSLADLIVADLADPAVMAAFTRRSLRSYSESIDRTV